MEVSPAAACGTLADLAEPLFVLALDASELPAELRFEAGPSFPHVEGPIERKALCAVGRLGSQAGRYRWPTSFHSLDTTLDAA